MRKSIGSDKDGTLYIAYEFKCGLPLKVVQHVIEHLCVKISFTKSGNNLTLIYLLPDTIPIISFNDYSSIMETVYNSLKMIDKYVDDCCAGVQHIAACINEVTKYANEESGDSTYELQENNRQIGKPKEEIVDKERKQHNAAL